MSSADARASATAFRCVSISDGRRGARAGRRLGASQQNRLQAHAQSMTRPTPDVPDRSAGWPPDTFAVRQL